MAKSNKIEERTRLFKKEYNKLKEKNLAPTHEVLKDIIGAASRTTISEILKERQNIQPDQWERFVSYFKITPVEKTDISAVSEHDRTEQILANLAELRRFAITLITGQSAGHEVMMSALDRLEKNPEGSLSAAADKLALNLSRRFEAIHKGMLDGTGK